MKTFLAGLAIFVLLCAPKGAGAKAHHPPNQPFSESDSEASLPNTTGPIITDDALVQPYRTWCVQITPTIPFVGGKFSQNWQRRSVHGNYRSLQVPVDVFYGLTPQMDTSFEFNFIQNWASNVGQANRAASFGSLGDSSFSLRYRFLDGKTTAPTLTGYFSVLFPTGHAGNLEPKLLGIDQTGNGAFAFTWGLDFFTYLPRGPILFYANVWYTNYAAGRVNGQPVYYPDQVTVNVAFEVPLKKSSRNRWAFLLEILSTWDAGRLFGPRANQSATALITILPALEFLPTERFTLAAGVQVDLFGKNTHYTYTPTLAWFINF